MKIKITLLFLFISILSFGQEKDSTKFKEIEFAEKLTYSINSEIFTQKEYKTEIDKEYKLPWNSDFYTDKQINQAIDTLINNATIKIAKGSFSNYNLTFNSYFPQYIDNRLIDIFKLSIKKNNISNNGNLLDIQTSGNSGFGSHSESGFKNGNSYPYNWKTLNSSFNIKTAIKKEEFKGSVLFESGFVKGYDYQKISIADVGKQMKIGAYEFKVIDVINSSVILDFKSNIDDLDFKFVNLNKEGYRIIASESIFSSMTLFNDQYQLFKKNPNVSFEEFKEAFHSKYMELIEVKEKKETLRENIFGKKYKVFSASGSLMNGYLILPKYISKKFEITYDENSHEHTPKAPKTAPSESKIAFHFESENEIAVLIGDTIELYDNELNIIKIIETGAFVKTIGKSLHHYNYGKKDDTCNGYRFVKIVYQDAEYIVKGNVIYKLEKFREQPKAGNNDLIFFETSKSQDYLQNIKPAQGFEFCEHFTYSPFIIYNVKNEQYNFIKLEKNELFSKISSAFKDANFLQTKGIYNLTFFDEGFYGFETFHNGMPYGVKITESQGTFIAKYML